MDNTQQKVRHIPIFVEGRDSPVINTGHPEPSNAGPPNASAPQQNPSNTTSAFASAESSTGPHFQNQHTFGRPPMGFHGDMGFGQDGVDGFHMPSASIFERAKDFPVRDFFGMRSASPRRSESPHNQHHQQQQQHQARSSPSPAGPQQRQPTPQNQDRSVPIQRSTTPQRQAPPPTAQPPTQPQRQASPAPQPQQPVPAKQKAIEDSITKIQKIQASVLELMARVEQYDGNNPKEYAYLDEMLTQNLLKLDDIDAEGKENIKSARREAIKCINSLISLMDAKNEEFKSRSASGASESKPEAASAEVAQDQPTQNGLNGASKNSSYDNVNNVKQTSSNNSVHMADAGTAEASLEAKLEEEVRKQQESDK